MLAVMAILRAATRQCPTGLVKTELHKGKFDINKKQGLYSYKASNNPIKLKHNPYNLGFIYLFLFIYSIHKLRYTYAME